MGSDFDFFVIIGIFEVSIHAPAWGATDAAHINWFTEGRFNSRSRMGSDIQKMRIWFMVDMFQFTLPHGERRRCAGR